MFPFTANLPAMVMLWALSIIPIKHSGQEMIRGKLTLLNPGYLADLQREDAKTDKQQKF